MQAMGAMLSVDDFSKFRRHYDFFFQSTPYKADVDSYKATLRTYAVFFASKSGQIKEEKEKPKQTERHSKEEGSETTSSHSQQRDDSAATSL